MEVEVEKELRERKPRSENHLNRWKGAKRGFREA